MLSSLLILAAPIAVQEPVPVLQEGDVVPGVGAVTTISNLAINGSGTWMVEADTDQANTDTDSVLVRQGLLFLREGDALPLPVGSTLDSFDSVSLSAAGDGAFNFFLDGTSGTSDDSGVYWNTTLLIQESELVDSMDVSPGTPYIGFFDVKSDGGDRMLMTASIDDPAIASTVDRLLAVLDVTGGALQSTDVIAKEEDVLPGMVEMVADFGTGPHQSAINSSGDVMFFADLTGDTTTDGTIWLNDTLLAQEGSPSPVGGRNWSSLSSPELDLGDGGD